MYNGEGEGEEEGAGEEGRLKRGKGRKLGTKRGKKAKLKDLKIDFQLSTTRQRGMVRG